MLDEREAGLELSDDVHLVIQPDEWEHGILPILRKIPNQEIASKTGLSRRQVIRLKQGKNRPHVGTLEKIKLSVSR